MNRFCRFSLMCGMVLVSLLLMLGCFWLPHAEPATVIRVIDAQGRAVVGARVELRLSSTVATGRTDSTTGQVAFSLPPGSYRVEVSDGVFALDKTITLREGSPVILELKEYLTPGIMGVVKRRDEKGLHSVLAGDPSVLTTRMILQGGLWEPHPAMWVVPALSTQDDSPQMTYWIWVPQLGDGSEILLKEAPQIRSVESFDEEGRSLFRIGSFPEDEISLSSSEIMNRSVYPLDALRPVGDLCAGPHTLGDYDGQIDVWDLIFLLQRYGTEDPDADIGGISSSVRVPPQRPFQTNVDQPGHGPDGKVDVWDLILLLQAYGTTVDGINTPFSPEVLSCEFLPNQASVEWKMPHAQDVHQSFIFFETDQDPADYLPNYAHRIAKISANPSLQTEYHATIDTSLQYLLLYAYNPGSDEHYFSAPVVLERRVEPVVPYDEVRQGIFVSGSLSAGADGKGQVQPGDQITIRTTAGYTGHFEVLSIQNSLRVRITLFCNEGRLILNGAEQVWNDGQHIDLDDDGLYDVRWHLLPEGSVIRSRDDSLLSILEFPDHPEAGASSGFQFHQGGLGVLFGRIVDQQWRLVVQSLDYEVYEMPSQGRDQRSISFRTEGLPELQVGDLMILPQWEGFFGRIRHIEDGPGYRTFTFYPDEAAVEDYFDVIIAEFNLNALDEMIRDPTPITQRDQDEWDFDEEWDRLTESSLDGLGARYYVRFATETVHTFLNDQATLTTDTRALLSAAAVLQYTWRKTLGVPTGIEEFKAGIAGEMLFRAYAELGLSVGWTAGGPLFRIPVDIPQPFSWLATVGMDIELVHEANIGVEGKFGFGYEAHCARHYFMLFYDTGDERWMIDAEENPVQEINVFRYRRIGPTYELQGEAGYSLNLHIRPTISLFGGLGRTGFGLGPGLSVNAVAGFAHDQEFEASFRIGFPLQWSARVDLLYGAIPAWSSRGEFFDFTLFRANLAIPWSPENLRARMADLTMVELQWDSESRVADGFEIQRREGPGEWEKIADLEDKDLRTHEDSEFAFGIPNEYRMRSFSRVTFDVFGKQVDGPDWRIPSLQWSSPAEIIPTRSVEVRAAVDGWLSLPPGEPGNVRIFVNDVEEDFGTEITAIAEEGEVVRLEARPHTRYAFNGWYEDGELLTYDHNYEFAIREDSQVRRVFQARFLEPGKMVKVEAGHFRMGNTLNDPEGDPCEEPAHRVYFSYEFELGAYPVTIREFRESQPAPDFAKEREDGRDILPVRNLSWWDAIQYCNWLSDQEGFKHAYDADGNFLDEWGNPTDDITLVRGYRLPTEAEWEYAARGGHKATSDFRYAGSDDLDAVSWWQDNAGGRPHPIGRKEANVLQLYDMSGNVYEWVHDHWDARYYAKDGPKVNPIGPDTPDDQRNRVLRGGSWDSPAEDCRVAHRYFKSFDTHDPRFGFRVARTLEESYHKIPVHARVDPRDPEPGWVRINEGPWGLASDAEVYEFLEVTLEAIEINPQWRFRGWYDENEREITDNPTHTFTPTTHQDWNLVALFAPYNPIIDDLEEGRDQIVKGAPGSVQYFRFERPYLSEPQYRGFDTWHVDILIHNRDGEAYLHPEGVENAEFFVKRGSLPSFDDFDERSGESEGDGYHSLKKVRLEKVEISEELYIMVHGLVDTFEVMLRAEMVYSPGLSQ